MSNIPENIIESDGEDAVYTPRPGQRRLASSATLSRRGFLAQSALATVGFAAAGALVCRAQTPEPPPPGPAPAAAGPAPVGGALKFDGPVDEAFWRKVRAQFSLVGGLTFLNNGTLGPVPRVVREVHEQWDVTLSENPTDSFRGAELDAVRRRAAAFVNAAPEEIALTRSTTEGLNIFARGLEWKAGDEVVIGSLEHFAATDAYKGLEKRFGIKIVTVDVPPLAQSVEEIVAAYGKVLTPRTRVLVVSHVSYVNGLILPIKELADLAHHRGALISVDGAQSLGVLPLDMRASGVDHYAAPGQKWLLAGTGTGITYVRLDLQERVQPLQGQFDPSGPRAGKPSARRYEQNGQYNIPGAVGIGTAIDFHAAVGKDNIEARDRALGSRLRSGAALIPGVKVWTPAAPSLSANLTTLSIGDLPAQAIAKALQEREGIAVRTVRTPAINGIRVSTHLYNTPDEVDRLLAVLQNIALNPASLLPVTREGRA